MSQKLCRALFLFTCRGTIMHDLVFTFLPYTWINFADKKGGNSSIQTDFCWARVRCRKIYIKFKQKKNQIKNCYLNILFKRTENYLINFFLLQKSNVYDSNDVSHLRVRPS